MGWFSQTNSNVGKITINGVTYEALKGETITVANGAVIINGVTITDGLKGIVKIVWEGPLAYLNAGCSVECGAVAGNVDAGNSVKCGDVQGSVKAGNSVTANKITGSVKAGNSVYGK